MLTLHPIARFPKDGEFYLCFDNNLEQPKVLNAPEGCSLGTWHKRKDGTWGGSSVEAYYKPMWWRHVPKVDFNNVNKEEK